MIKVRVKDGAALGAYRDNEARLNILPGLYDVEITAEGNLIFKCSDTNDNGDLFVKLEEYIELKEFPNINKNSYIEIIK